MQGRFDLGAMFGVTVQRLMFLRTLSPINFLTVRSALMENDIILHDTLFRVTMRKNVRFVHQKIVDFRKKQKFAYPY